MPHASNTLENKVTTNPLDEETKSSDTVESLYNDEEKEYLDFVQQRLESAKRQKNHPREEFNGKTYYQYFNQNEEVANTILPKKMNEDDVVLSAGTVEEKLDALLSHVHSLNLQPEVLALDQDSTEIVEVGKAMEDIMHDTAKQEPGSDESGDEEKRMSRQRELLKQGTVFVQEEWLKSWEMKAKLKDKDLYKNFKGEFRMDEDKWEKDWELAFEGPSRSLLYGPNVFLGDITQFYMDKQPYVFVVIHDDYENAKKRFGKWDNWDYVNKGRVDSEIEEESATMYDNNWRLTEVKDNQVEIIIYQDQPKDEFQIIINGVMMMPIGFPLSAVTPAGKYNIAKQVFRISHNNFAYGTSFVSSGSVPRISKVIDEMLKLFVLKTRKSISPPYANMSGRTVDRKVLSPGRISMGINPGSLVPIGQEGQGVTQGEIAFLEKMNTLIDKSTVSDQFTGNFGKSGTTATEVLEVQRQARLTLGLTITVCALLEKKLAYLRLYNLLQNWFKPIGSRVVGYDDGRRLVNEFRSVNRETNIEGEGLGERKVIVTDEGLPSPEEIRRMELNEEKKRKKPVRKIFLDANKVQDAKLLWFISVTPQEKESSAFFKIAFRDMLNNMLALMQIGSVPKKDGLEEQFSRAWGVRRNKLFQGGQPELPGVSAEGPINSVEQIEQSQGRSAGDGAVTAGTGGQSLSGGNQV